MQIIVNGDQRMIPEGLSLQGLIESLDLDPRMIVVEHNRTIVRRPQLDSTTVNEGDQIELVHFVGGG